ncbi:MULTISPECIES: TonB-dependent siderophore receptor [unclassified Duganella]|uniref:TonB-dependent receptor n=1 Tax=unclassified Duganella TaxID=2636909 RepID=UPI000E3477FB|nr:MULTISPECIES: TonB-dependent siderophore receptor [unclassified Duganella]RFP16145.1 TonB-dependent siderophore receptor [Duganella sp. BJB475]RFP32692.1 TonB-dependent siderophore receptor [Duganella sp. BJB476]
MALNKKPLALMLASLTLTNAALAQTGAAPEQTMAVVTVTGEADAGYRPTTSTSATKIEAPLRDIPQTVNVVPQALLRDQGARSLQDALKAVPGIGMSTGDGQRDQVTIRGFSAISDQFVDGMRDDALYFRDLSNVEQVEVIKGPASVLYGRGSSGGMINRITKKPGMERSEVSLQAGSWGQKRGEFDLARNLSEHGVAFRVTGAMEDADSYRNQQFLKREAVAPSLQFKLGADTLLLLQAEYLHDKRLTDFGIPSYQGRTVDVPPSTYYGAANARDFDYSESRVHAFGFTLDHRFNQAFSIRNAFRHYNYTLDRNNTLIGSVNEVAKTASLTRGNVARDENGYTNQTELTQHAELAGMQHQVLYGVEFGRQNKDQLVRSQANVATVSLFNPINPVVPFTAGGAPTANNLGIFKVASAYVQDLVTMSPQWKALAGIRYDKFEQETVERRVGVASVARTDRNWSPRAGLVYQPDPAQSYYASFSRSFQPSGEGFALAVNNADIAPEVTKNKEVGAKYDLFGGRASAGVSLFQLTRTNMKSSDPVTNRLIPLGTQRSNGLELTFSGDLGDGWQAWSGYSYLDASMLTSIAKDDGQPVQGKHPTLTPKHSINLWVSKALAGHFGVGGGLNYVGDRFANPGNTVTLPSFVTADAMAYYRYRNIDLTLNVMNLLDKAYIVAGHGSSKNLSLPGAPRSAQLTARYRF